MLKQFWQKHIGPNEFILILALTIFGVGMLIHFFKQHYVQ